MNVVILCGGLGTRLREETEYKPKPMVEIGSRPIIWHIMKIYSHYGFSDFVLCLGYKGEMIKEYFYHYKMRNSDFTVELKSGNIEIHDLKEKNDWKVTLVDTGKNTMTGARVKKIEKYIKDNMFLLTYGDGLADVNIKDTVKFHKKNGKIGTVTGVYPPSRYGELKTAGKKVISFAEKPLSYTRAVNGGFFVFNREIFDYLSEKEDCVLEREPLEKLAKDGELDFFEHRGFWQCMDTYRDYQYLNELWEKRKAPWKVW